MSFALLAGGIGSAAAFLGADAAVAAAIGTIGAGVVGGAGLGALGSAVTGGDVGKGALFGALGGGLGGGVTSLMGAATGGAGALGAGEISQIADQTGTEAASIGQQAAMAAPNTGSLTGDLGAMGFTAAPAGSEFALSGITPSMSAGVAPTNAAIQAQTEAQAQNAAQQQAMSAIQRAPYPTQAVPTPAVAGQAPAQQSTGIGGFMKDNPWVAPAGMMAMPFLSKMFSPNYNVPSQPSYSGPLSKFHYDPSQYTPTVAVPQVYHPSYAGYAGAGYAEGGVTSLTQSSGAPNLDFMDGGSYPMSQQDHMVFNTPTQMPAGAQEVAAQYEVKTNPLTGEPVAKFAHGGIANLAEGGRLLNGAGDGVSDDIPAHIDGKQPAKLSEGEFVVPARIVSELGNGSTDAGAKRLYAMMDRIQKQRGKTTGKGKFSVDSKAYRALPA